jgi:hypothetical protein
MRKAPSGTSDIKKERPSLDGVHMHDWYGVLREHYNLKHEEAFDDLADLLFGYSCRDQEGEPTDEVPKELTDRRSEGYRLATAMRDNAAAMIKSLDTIHSALNAFNDEIVRWHPPLLEAILDTDLEGPGNLFLPDELSVLMTFFGEHDWDAAAAVLTKMSSLPVKEKLARGPVPNTTLRRAVKACRDYWKDVEGKKWTMSSLKHNEGRNPKKGASRANLQGKCEAFVADLLFRSGIRYSLQELSSAWVIVDRLDA